MNWLEKLRERVTHYRELKEALALLQARLERQETENDALSARLRLAEEEKGAVSERLAVLEQDRSELFTRQDRSRTELAETAERLEVRPRLTDLEQDRQVLWGRLTELGERFAILEQDRTELFARLDDLRERVEELSQRAEDDSKVTVLEQDRTEAFRQLDALRAMLGETAAQLSEAPRTAQLEADRTELFARLDDLRERVEELSRRTEDDSRVAVLERDRTELVGRCDQLQIELQKFFDKTENDPRFEILENDRDELFIRCDRLSETIVSSQKTIDKLDCILSSDTTINGLLPIVMSESDSEYDIKIMPINQFLTKNGLAISMHLTSVDEQLPEVVYQTADMIRSSTLAMIADEIKRKDLDGQVAELGVAEGKFSAVINALFPEKKLYLFDTFEGFPDSDLDYERKCGYSDQQRGTYSGIEIEDVLRKMKYPKNCIIRKGYFPETAKGLEETFCFVSIDCDLYNPIYAGLSYFYPRVISGGYIFVHDYRSKYYRGVKEALIRFAEEFGISYCVLPDNTGTAIIVK